jgi:DNA-binding NarL/FixJ family response regulator
MAYPEIDARARRAGGRDRHLTMMDRLRAPEQDALSAREIEILEQVARRRTNKEIAGTLFISEATVKTHLLHIFAKLDVQDRTRAVTVALDRGILRLDT